MKINAVLQKYPKLERPEAVFEISNIVDGFFEKIRIDGRVYIQTTGISDIPSKPPFTHTWYEYTQSFPDGAKLNNGVYLIDDKIEKKWKFLLFYLPSTNIKTLERIGSCTYPYNDEFIGICDKSVVSTTESYGLMNAQLERDSSDCYKELEAMVKFVLYSNILLNCKNVSTDAHDFPNRRSISHYKKTGKPYFEKYYTLKVKLPGKKHTAGSGENGGWSNAFHIYRGHFKTYTEAAPLFGKFTGTYWWESGIRGNLETGIIDKDYELEVGE